MNCVYCECGATNNLTLERKEYVPFNDVTEEIDHYMESKPDLDYFTFSGAGEPLLNSRIGDVLKHLKTNYPDIPVAVLTNGSLFDKYEIRRELLIADLVLPSLDAVQEKTLASIDRPHRDITAGIYLDGLIKFSNEYKGTIWLEIFILPGYNDSQNDLDLFKKAIILINPDKVQLNTIDRPGTIHDLRPANRIELQHIINVWKLDNVEIIASTPDRKKIKSYRKDIEASIKETISRRPCTIDDLSSILGLHINEINKYLGVLEEKNEIELSRQKRGLFYQYKNH